MHLVRPLCFMRRRRLRLRPLVLADLPGLQWVDTRRTTRKVEALPSPEILADVLDKAPHAQVAVELDHRLVGALLAAPVAWQSAPVAQPWDRLEGHPPALEVRAEGAVLRGCGAVWLDVLSADEMTDMLTVARKAVVQQLGLEATVSLVEAIGWPQWRSRMEPEAYLQQVHAGGFEEPALRLMIANGWVVRGFWEVEGALQVVMWWGNRVR